MQRPAHIVIPACLAAAAAAEWLHGGAAGWAWLAAVGALATLLVYTLRARPPRVAQGLATLATCVVALVLVRGVLEVQRIECCWAAVRAGRVTRAAKQVRATLSDIVANAERLAERGAAAAALPRAQAFAALAEATRRGPRGIERGLVVTSRDGQPWAWAGRHRFIPAFDTTPLRAVITPFYVSLEARRQTQAGGWAVASVLLDATPAAPDRSRALAAAFAASHGVELEFLGAGEAPSGPDVVRYPAAGATVFSVQTVPPAQGDAKLQALRSAAAGASLALTAALLLLLAAATPGAWRWMVALVGAWCAVRAPLGPTPALAAFFSPATFYRPVLGQFSASAGSLTVFAALVLFGAGALWRRGWPRRWWSLVAAGLLVFEAPYLVRDMGRGITPPARGVGIALWLSWETTLAVASMALILLAAALVRGEREPERTPWTLPVACAWTAVAAVAGLWLWEPNGAWPDWYTFLWLPALVGVLVPAPRRWAVVAIATVAGTAAALVTWGATVEGRMALANRDARTIGREGDPLAAALLRRVGEQATAAPAPHTAGDLYTLWLASPLEAAGYPAVLSVWTRAGDLAAELPLATLDLRPSLFAALAHSTETPGGPRVERMQVVPGVHYVLVAPLADGDVLTVAVGPRSGLVPSSRVARFLEGEQPAEPAYEITLTPPGAAVEAEGQGPPGPAGGVSWVRDGWSARGDRHVELPGGVRHVHLRVDLRGPWPLLVRGVLVVALDVVVLACCWWLGVVLRDGWRPRFPPVLAGLRRSYRVRLAMSLAAFFVLPVVGFEVWSIGRISDEARDVRDLLIRQTLKDVATTAGGASFDRPEGAQRAILDLGAGLDADLWLFRGGVLAAATTPVLAELGLLDPYLSGAVFRRVTLEDEVDVTADGRAAGRTIRIGYRVVVPGAVLAAPQLLDGEQLGQKEEDVTLALLLVACVGLGAAILLAGVVARGLTRPVASLSEAAAAVGRGSALPEFPAAAPREFTPVMQAFERMAEDVRSSQSALEEARRRTAQVLANVATGVIALDHDLRITTANPRARDLIGRPLEPGQPLEQGGAADGDWRPVWEAVRAFVADGGDDIVEREIAVGSRQIRMQIAPLGLSPDERGCVVSLDDTTGATRAARVLAWGEMARQVAHEIKNPLTPIRLGMQHLLRARASDPQFDATLSDTARRILAEIDRLDAIARAFSRFASPGAEAPPLESVDLHAVASEVVQLYALGGEERGTRVELAGAPPSGPPVLARRDEVKEVLVNLLENSRNAGAQHVVVRLSGNGRGVEVQDDGRGIPPEVLGRVFDPAFSTTSSGSGLGLAIARRLVESWGGTIDLSSTVGRGTTVRITLVSRAAGATS